MMKVYVSGPMTGRPALNFPAFNEAAAQLRALGYDVVNPAEINPDASMPWAACMRADIKALCDCDAVATLPEWEKSRGATLEVHIAERLGMAIAPVSTWAEAATKRANRPAALGDQAGPVVGAPANAVGR